MSDTALLVLDQLRYTFSLLIAQLLFFWGAAPRREHFARRMLLFYGLCTLVALGYVPIYLQLTDSDGPLLIQITAATWFVLLALSILAQWFCFDLGPCNTLFRCLVGCAMESIATTLVRSLLVTQLFPDFPGSHPVLYIAVMLGIYTGIYAAGWHILGRSLQKNADTGIPEDTRTFCIYAAAHIGFCTMIMLCKTINEWILQVFEPGDSEGYLVLLRCFNIGVMLLSGTVILITQYYVYAVGVLRAERDLFARVMAEKASQYEHSRDNIAAINQKCHDLKHQLLALRAAGEGEREKMLSETEQAVMFYDSAVKTDNEVLDTLLTEKSTICAYKGIRFSCTVHAQHLNCFGVVDLYTILGNSLDNAIESAEQLAQPEQKTISFTISERGNMLLIAIENYYSGTIQMKGDLPITHKADSSSHGIGLKSVRTLTRQYGGELHINTENQIFLLQIMIPIPDAGSRQT